MAKTNAYECDGPKCEVIGRRGARAHGPEDWLEVTLQWRDSQGTRSTGSFHDEQCARTWIDNQFDRWLDGSQRDVAGDEIPTHTTTTPRMETSFDE